ncbi:MAG: hypothetical protein H6617_05550 [Bdellovibrionaceae bacterium]|nr:hypothetical protein [Bdellovibrionales bacterium]MCB9254129.1 hypothetical protein [Pseudobdellovibrionaceae bacterium]
MAGAATSGYFLYVDLTGNALHSPEQGVAQVTRRVSKVRKKAKASFLWQSVNEGSQLQKRDSLQVGEASSATIKLKDDTLLEVGEHSLVIIDDVPPLEMKFVKGTFVVRGKKQDFRINAEENKAPVIEKIPVRLLSPSSFQNLYVQSDSKTEVMFEWLELGEEAAALQPQLQVSRSRKFKDNSTQVFSPEKGQSMFRVALAPGNYYWRLMSPRLQSPEVREFHIQNARGLDPVYPANEKTVQQWTANSPVEFRWIPSRYGFPSQPHLQIATTNNFETKNLRVDEEISAESGRARVVLPTGNYFWRLAATYPQFTILSTPRSLSVESVKSIPIALNAPQENAELPLTESTSFSWQFPIENTLFELEIEQLRGEKTIATALKKRLSAYSLRWRARETGHYRWRVSALHAGASAVQSDWRHFNVMDRRPLVLKGPEDKKLFGYWKEAPEFSLEWEDIKTEKDQQYHIRIGTSSFLNQEPRSYNTQTPYIKSGDMQLPDGKYYWTVTLERETGEPIRVSEKRSFSIGVHPLLQAPREIFPKHQQTVNVVRFREDQDPVLEWEPVESATQYEVRLLDRGGRELASAKTDKTRFPLKAIKEGKYRWTVRAIDPLDRGGLPLPFKNFSITYGDPLKAPEILGSKVE